LASDLFILWPAYWIRTAVHRRQYQKRTALDALRAILSRLFIITPLVSNFDCCPFFIP